MPTINTLMEGKNGKEENMEELYQSNYGKVI
jgi:hypothetical protein